MPIRANSSTDAATITASLPSSSTAFTMCGWGKHVTTQSGVDGIMAMLVNTGSTVAVYMTFDLGVLNIGNGTTDTAFASSPTNNTWFFWAFTNSTAGANNFNGYWAAPGASLSSMVTVAATAPASFTPATLYLCNDAFNEFFDGSLAAVKCWNAVLTQAELHAEMNQYLPRRYANIYGYWPLWRTTNLKDYGNGAHPFTAAGTLAEDTGGPPIPLGNK